MLISFQKKRKLFWKEWLDISDECLIFARSYIKDKRKNEHNEIEFNQPNY